jgi:DNA-binding transcriptional regulator of glucitol operon
VLVKQAAEEFIRGLIDSDGCRVVANGRGIRSVRYHFSNRSDDIRALFCAALDDLGIPWTRPSRYQVAIYRKAATARLDEFVGPEVLSRRDLPPRYRRGVSTTRRRRPALVALVLLAAGGCLALGWWQLTRFQSVGGTFQNLGYALQWPLFAGFFVYAYYKFVRYEEAPPRLPKDRVMTEIPDGLLPERPKPVSQPDVGPALREYNAYLAELAKSDQERQGRATA